MHIESCACVESRWQGNPKPEEGSQEKKHFWLGCKARACSRAARQLQVRPELMHPGRDEDLLWSIQFIPEWGKWGRLYISVSASHLTWVFLQGPPAHRQGPSSDRCGLNGQYPLQQLQPGHCHHPLIWPCLSVDYMNPKLLCFSAEFDRGMDRSKHQEGQQARQEGAERGSDSSSGHASLCGLSQAAELPWPSVFGSEHRETALACCPVPSLPRLLWSPRTVLRSGTVPHTDICCVFRMVSIHFCPNK